ncbi:hypothetical protein EJB05_26762, partial [Eragrostis curvula]
PRGNLVRAHGDLESGPSTAVGGNAGGSSPRRRGPHKLRRRSLPSISGGCIGTSVDPRTPKISASGLRLLRNPLRQPSPGTGIVGISRRRQGRLHLLWSVRCRLCRLFTEAEQLALLPHLMLLSAIEFDPLPLLPPLFRDKISFQHLHNLRHCRALIRFQVGAYERYLGCRWKFPLPKGGVYLFGNVLG